MCWCEDSDHIMSRNITCWKYEGNIGEAVEQEEKICNEDETVKLFTYLGGNVNAGGGCEVAMTA